MIVIEFAEMALTTPQTLRVMPACTEIDMNLYEQATVETDLDLAWTSGPKRSEPEAGEDEG